MKTTSLSNLKKELALLPPNEVLSVCLKLVKFKKENKELLSYLLFDANNEPEYIESIKAEIDIQFAEINLNNLYIAKKSIRKILRNANKFIKYSGLKQTEVELLMHFCLKMKSLGRMVKSSNTLSNLYENQLRKIRLAINKLHEDLQHDYLEELKRLN
jgi:hypothetical protein